MISNPMFETNLVNTYAQEYNDIQDYNECTGNYFDGDIILESIWNGNWTQGVKFMLKIYATPMDFARFLQDKKEEGLINEDFFNYEPVACVTDLYHELRNK